MNITPKKPSIVVRLKALIEKASIIAGGMDSNISSITWLSSYAENFAIPIDSKTSMITPQMIRDLKLYLSSLKKMFIASPPLYEAEGIFLLLYST